MTQNPPQVGYCTWLEPDIRRVLAPNPSPMTLHGTNSYLLGRGNVAIIDPGPNDPTHLRALLAALAPGERISHILVTHSHLDHSPLARSLSEHSGAPILAFGDSTAGRSPALAGVQDLGGGEGVDHTFQPDMSLQDGQVIDLSTGPLQAIWTPGHMGNHMCFASGDRLFSGDHVMGWASSMVSPPDGDLRAFVNSLKKLQMRQDRIFYPGHGAAVDNPPDRLAELIAHRLMRETQILEALQSAPGTPAELTARIYTDIPPALLGAAERNVLAHLMVLCQDGRALCQGPLARQATYRYAS